jgi:hypothetical protein
MIRFLLRHILTLWWPPNVVYGYYKIQNTLGYNNQLYNLHIFHRVSSYNIRNPQITPPNTAQIIHFNFAVRTPPIFKGTYPYQSAQLVLLNLIIRSLIVHQRFHLKGLLEFYQY